MRTGNTYHRSAVLSLMPAALVAMQVTNLPYMVIHDAWLCYPLPWAIAGVVTLSVSMNVIVISAQGDQFDTWLCNSLVLQV